MLARVDWWVQSTEQRLLVCQGRNHKLETILATFADQAVGVGDVALPAQA